MRLTPKRRIIQTLALIGLNVNFWSVSALQNVCLPVMNCEACVVSWFGCPVGMMAKSIAFMEFPLIVIGCVLGIGLLVGRLFCGWLCPMGFLQDLLYKIPRPKFSLPRFLTWFKYGFLVLSCIVVVLIIGPEYEFSKLFFCNYCPTAALDVVLPNMIMYQDYAMDFGRILRFSVLGVVLFLAVANHRSFCKIMCPVGAMVAITNKFSFFSLKLKKDTCISCKKCDKSCPMDVKVMESPDRTGRAINRSTECIECLTCEATCPVTAISNNSRILKK
jgi:polyferredoxin